MNTDRFFVLVVFAYLFAYLYLIDGLKSLPTCQSCDYYFEQGNVMHLVESFNLSSDSSSHLGHISQGPQLTYFFPALLVWLFKVGVLQANLMLSFIIIPVSLFIYYNMFQKVFWKKEVALACSLVAFPISTFPLLKYSEYAFALSLPIFLWLLIDYFQKQGIKRAILLGIGIGIMGLSHANAFFLSYILVFCFAFVMLVFSEDRISFLRKNWPLAIACALGFLISLLWWYKPLFVFGGKVYPGFGYAAPDFTDPLVYFGSIILFLKSIFFDFANLRNAILCIICIIGLGEMTWRIRKGNANALAVAVWFAFFVAVFHFIITSPLLGMDFSPAHSLFFLYPIAAAFALGQIADFKEKRTGMVLLLFAALLLAGNLLGAVEKRNSELYSYGFKGNDACLASLASWAKENTGINDVFLSTPYACNHLNGMTGRKCMQMDLGHSSKFDDVGRSIVDASVVLYGNSSEMRKELLQEYKVGFLYWDYSLAQNGGEFTQYENNSTAWMHPILRTPENEMLLAEGGVKYSVGNTWIDPAVRGGMFRKFDVILLAGDIPHNATHPWSPGLDQYLSKEWECGNMALYRVAIK